MHPSDTQRLADILARRRQELGLSARDVARQAGVDVGTVTRIELGQIASPRPDSLKAIAGVLGLPVSDLFTVADWLPKHELPSFSPYLRAKYRELPDSAIAEIEAFTDRLRREHGGHGPRDGEDEI